MAIAIAVILAGVGVLILWLGSRLLRNLLQSAGELAEKQPEAREIPASPEPVQADALVYLFANRFARPPKAGRSAGRFAALDPLTNQELDPREVTLKMLFAMLAEQYETGTIDYRIVPHVPGMMPPFPHKNWEMEVRRVEPLLPSPLGDCLGVAFDMVEKATHARRAKGAAAAQEETPALPAAEAEPEWYPLDLLIEKILQVVRAETGFWEREGVYGDIRNYVIDALIAEGYLIEQGGDTWIDHFRRRRLEPNREAIEALTPAAEALLRRLYSLRQRLGSTVFLSEEEPDVCYTHLNTPASLTTVDDPEQGPMWADALGISLYEVLVSLRQLEPSNEGGA